MRVYRLEHRETRKGPWRHGPYSLLRDAALEWYEHTNRHTDVHDTQGRRFPLPRQDGICREWASRDDVVCGCASEEQLAEWFPPGVQRALGGVGFVLAVYDATMLQVGERQVAFSRHGAEHMGDRDLTERPFPYGPTQRRHDVCEAT